MLSPKSDNNAELSQNKTCGVCQNKLTLKCLYCNLCDMLLCLTCLEISTQLFDVLNDAATSSPAVMIVCQLCRNESFQIIRKHIDVG